MRAVKNYTCQNCKKEFQDYTCKKRIYCSPKCYVKDNSYEKNVTWKDGHKITHKLAFERYKMKKECSICKTKENLVVHHINKDTTNNSKDNFQIMCASCHLSYHHKGVSHKPTFTGHHTKESKKLISIATTGEKNGFYGKKWEDYGGHPKGMLNKKHTKATKLKQGEASKKMWIKWRLIHNKKAI